MIPTSCAQSVARESLVRHLLIQMRAPFERKRALFLKPIFWIAILGSWISLQSEMVVAGQVLTRPRLDYCAQQVCLGIIGNNGFVGRDGQTYLLEKIHLELQGASLPFLKDAVAQKAIVDLGQKRLKLYRAQISGHEMDLVIDLENFEIKSAIQSLWRAY